MPFLLNQLGHSLPDPRETTRALQPNTLDGLTTMRIMRGLSESEFVVCALSDGRGSPDVGAFAKDYGAAFIDPGRRIGKRSLVHVDPVDLVWRRPFHRLDHKDFDGATTRFQFQAELFLKRGEQ